MGILSAYWRILHKSIKATNENVEKYTLGCLALHNYLRLPDNAHYTLSGFADLEDKDGNLLPGEWKLLKRNDSNNIGLVSLPYARGSCSRQDAFEARNELKILLNSDEGSLSWQSEYI